MMTPNLALDFTTAALDSRVTFARATSASNPATYVDANGYIVPASNNQARFDYDPVTLACKGLLIEESRTNLQLNSEDISGWAVSNCSITSNQTAAPNGNVTADLITENSASAEHFAYGSEINISSIPYSQTFFLKSNGRNAQVRVAGGNTFAYIIVNVNLAAGTVGNPAVYLASNAAATISPSANGFYRVTVTGTFDVSVTRVYPVVYTTNGSSTNYQGDGVSGVYVWGQQFEAGSFATSYIPTTTTSLTRNADVATITGANFSSWWVASQGGVTANFRPSTVSGIRPIIQYDDGTANEIITLRGNTTNPELYIVDGGTPQAQIDAGTIAANTDYSLTGWWATNDCKAKLNSGAIVTDTTATIPTVTQARIGSDGTNYLNGTIASLNYYGSFTGQIYTRRKNKVIFSLM